MIPILRRVFLSLALLTAAGLILLLSDLHSRQGARKSKEEGPARIPVALLKHTSTQLTDDVERGVLEQLAAAGYSDGSRLALQRFCAEGDLPTANAIAQKMTDGSFKMAITISTLSLQCVANANKSGRAIHVFGAVTDPAGAGVGIRAMNSTNKPPWLAGIGTFQPVEQILREAKRLWPGLRVVGEVWNPAERNSEVCTIKAREVCRTLGIQFLEANVDQSKDVREAAESLIARGAQALWIGGDVTVINATAPLCEAALKARIPAFSSTSGHVREGSLFDLGANYAEVGRCIGAIAAAILDGADPARMVITNFMPQRVMLNKQVLKQMRDPWRFAEDVVARADLILGEDGQVEKRGAQPGQPALPGPAGHRPEIGLVYFGPEESPASPAAGPAPARCWTIYQIAYAETPMTEDATRGFRDGLKEAGLGEGTHFKLATLCAQGEMATLSALFDSAATAGTDLYAVYGTPTLQTAMRKVQRLPVVFTVVADPVVAGVGKSDQDHLPNITGVYTVGPYREMAELLHREFPRIKRVGTLFCPAEANSVANKDIFVREAARCGIAVEVLPANTAGELPDAARALCSRRLDALVQVLDSLCASGFPAIGRAAAQAHLPAFAFQSGAVQQGAALALARDYYDAGRETAFKAAQIMRGESPARIPLSPPTKTWVLVNVQQARESGLTIPEAVLQRAKLVTVPSPQP